jgi:hypothetical protein
MNRTPDVELVLREWFADDGAPAPGFLLDAIEERIGRQPQRRTWPLKRRPTVTTFKLAAALAAALMIAVVGWNLLPRGTSNGSAPTPSPTRGIAPTPAASAISLEPTIDLSAGVAHRMTPDDVEQVVLQKIAADEARAGERLVTPRILLVRLMPPGATSTASTGGAFTASKVAWLVEFEGTVVSCGNTCDAFTGGAVLVDDRSGELGAAAYAGHVGDCVRTGETSCVITHESPTG